VHGVRVCVRIQTSVMRTEDELTVYTVAGNGQW